MDNAKIGVNAKFNSSSYQIVLSGPWSCLMSLSVCGFGIVSLKRIQFLSLTHNNVFNKISDFAKVFPLNASSKFADEKLILPILKLFQCKFYLNFDE